MIETVGFEPTVALTRVATPLWQQAFGFHVVTDKLAHSDPPYSPLTAWIRLLWDGRLFVSRDTAKPRRQFGTRQPHRHHLRRDGDRTCEVRRVEVKARIRTVGFLSKR